MMDKAAGSAGYAYGAAPRVMEISSQVLAPELRRQLDRALPPHLQEHDWKLLYSSLMHGGSLTSFRNHVAGETHTLVAFETEGGEVLGGFATEEWHTSSAYYGTGQSFVWREHMREGHPAAAAAAAAAISGGGAGGRAKGGDDDGGFAHFGWSGANNYVMHTTENAIAMGGGGSFAWFLDADFSRGSSSACSTFGNPRLASEEMFEVCGAVVLSLSCPRSPLHFALCCIFAICSGPHLCC
jgi:hypothetical protein